MSSLFSEHDSDLLPVDNDPPLDDSHSTHAHRRCKGFNYGIDFRKIEENKEYAKNNVNRPKHETCDGLYADIEEVSDTNTWSGETKTEARVGLIQVDQCHGLEERSITFGEANASAVNE